MEANGKQTPLTVGSGPPPRYFGIPEEPWEDGALYVLRVDGRSAWLEVAERDPSSGRITNRSSNRTSTADFEP